MESPESSAFDICFRATTTIDRGGDLKEPAQKLDLAPGVDVLVLEGCDGLVKKLVKKKVPAEKDSPADPITKFLAKYFEAPPGFEPGVRFCSSRSTLGACLEIVNDPRIYCLKSIRLCSRGGSKFTSFTRPLGQSWDKES